MRRLMLLLAAAFLLAGCSTHAMRAVPVFKSDPKPEEAEIDMERVNAWPLYYKDGDVRSAFWPLYTSTAEGHALVPFYEYRRGDRSLRLGQITHLLPALASFEPERNHSWRVLLAYKEDAVARLGSFTRQPDDGILLVPPFLFWNGETLWTPLIARGKGSDHSMWGMLYPLFFAEKRGDRKQVYALAPLIAAWWGSNSAGAQAIPLFHYNRKMERVDHERTTRFNLGAIVAHYYRNPNNGKLYTYLGWPLVQHSNRGRTDAGTWRGGWVNVLAIAFHHYRDTSKRQTIVLWPLFQHSNRGKDAAGDWRGGWANVLGLAFHRYESPNQKYMFFLWPFYQRGEKVSHSGGPQSTKWMNMLGLVAHRYRSPEITRGFLLWPLWIDRVHLDQEARMSQVERTMTLGTSTREETLSLRYALAGLFAQRREALFERIEADEQAAAPARVERRVRDHSRLFPLYWSEKYDTGEKKLLILWRLYDAQRVPLETTEQEWRRERILWRLYRREERGTRTATDSFPFMSSARDTATGFRRWTLAGGLYERRTEEGVRTTKLLWIPVSRSEVRQN